MCTMPPVRRFRHPSTSRARWALGLALWALVLGQWLALAHAIGHPQGLRTRAPLPTLAEPAADGGPGAMAGHAAAPATAGSAFAQRPTLLHFVTAHADGSPACQLFDDLAQPTPSAMPVPALLQVLAHDTPAPALQDGVRRIAPGPFRARAPPAFA